MSLLQSSYVPRLVRRCSAPWRRYERKRAVLADWRSGGRPAPPPELVKRRTIRQYARRFDVSTLIETGTYYGETIAECKDAFRQVYSIELDDDLFRLAQARFTEDRHVKLLHGDSGIVLSEVLDEVDDRALFWLDGHYSGGVTARADIVTPILQELETIFDHHIRDHVVLIDDARLFTGSAYPTVDVVRDLVGERRPNWRFEVKNDIIRIHE